MAFGTITLAFGTTIVGLFPEVENKRNVIVDKEMLLWEIWRIPFGK